MLSIVLAVLLASTSLNEGDRLWNLRAEGSSGGRAAAAPIDGAIAAYEKAVAENPNALEPRWKLLRSLRFKGAYVAQSNDEKKAIYSKAKAAGEDALKVVYRHLQVAPDAPEKQVAAAAKKVAGAGEVFAWDAVN
ncbi:MAG TPA: hypothetical protein VFT12_13365, partial [Thermoanaerobaculia bacterium]|nr:hypothetical protein [Thermoanaerobaculia bacterium]